MAKIWFIKDRGSGQRELAGEKPIAWCVANLGLVPWDWKAAPVSQFMVGNEANISPHAKPHWVMIEIKTDEAIRIWRAGYYISPMITIDRVRKCLS